MVLVRLTPSVSVNFYPKEESSEFQTSLVVRGGGTARSYPFRFPVTFQYPNRVISARLPKTNTWLVLGTEDTDSDALSFCLAVYPAIHKIKLAFAEEGGVEERVDLLRRRAVREWQIAKWVFGTLPRGTDSNDLWVRTGVFDPKRSEFSFRPWRKAVTHRKRHGASKALGHGGLAQKPRPAHAMWLAAPEPALLDGMGRSITGVDPPGAARREWQRPDAWDRRDHMTGRSRILGLCEHTASAVSFADPEFAGRDAPAMQRAKPVGRSRPDVHCRPASPCAVGRAQAPSASELRRPFPANTRDVMPFRCSGRRIIRLKGRAVTNYWGDDDIARPKQWR